MLAQFLTDQVGWSSLDTAIALTGAVAAMSCALPGIWLLLRRQSMLGDALSHAVLPGIVIAYLAVTWFEKGHVSDQVRVAEGMSIVFQRQLTLFIGAGISGVIAAVLSELIQRWGRVERSAALGVVFTSMFAIGLLLIRLLADKVHLDAGCVLYGNLEANAEVVLPGTRIPQSLLVNGGMLLLNGLLVALFFKELKLCTFDPGLAEAYGFRPALVSLAVMSITAATVVTAFDSVGAILVIAMLIVPGATARFLTDRLGLMVWISLVIAGVSAVLGHLFAITLPEMICSRIGFPQVKDVGTAGMIAVTTGGMFLLAVIVSPQHGIARSLIDRFRLQIRIAREDILGRLYREAEASASAGHELPHPKVAASAFVQWIAWRRLVAKGLVQTSRGGDILTKTGEELARSVVRSHRLWELYMSRHFEIPDDHLHATAEKVEHYLGPELQAELAAELDQPTTDPHGKSIPTESGPN
jgi:manganese/zinc/iron transport system permease protein